MRGECLRLARENPLVGSAELAVSGVFIFFKGDNGKYLVQLQPASLIPDEVNTPNSISEEQAYEHVEAVVKALRAFNPVSIELGQGKFDVDGKQ